MATNPVAATPNSVRSTSIADVQKSLELVLAPVASLKLTVTLFFLSTLIVLFGTLAQRDMTMWEVKSEYFESYITWVSISAIQPKALPEISGGFFFPGGALIGLMLIMNLAAAHLVRFKIHAKGSQLLIGLIGMSVGALITLFVILGGQNSQGVQGQPFLEWNTLWRMMQVSLVVFWFLAVYSTIQLVMSRREGGEGA